MKRQFTAALVLIAVFLAACAQQGGQDTVRIGFLGPLTGDIVAIGEASLAAAQMAVDEINAAGGIGGMPVELVVEDGHCDSKTAATAASKLINVEGVQYIVGGECSAETLAAAPIAEQSGVVALSPLSSSPAVTDAGDYIFRDYPSDSFAGEYLAQYMYQQGYRNPAVLYCLTDYCKGLADVFKEAFGSYDGASIAAEDAFANDARDLRSQITKMKAAQPDSVVFLAYTEAAVVGLKQMDELGLDMPKLGTDTFDDATIMEQAGASGEGLQYMIPYTPENAEFNQKFRDRTGGEPKAGTPQTYDAVYIFAKVIGEGASTPAEVRDALYAMEPYQGVSGTISFDENGDLESSAYLVKEYRDGAQVPLGVLDGGIFTAMEG